jgi:TetR/AcrR family acrAB operon transcriptional repressor
MVRRTKEEALETRNRILDTAEHVFHERGVSHTSLAHIAQAAGVTRGAIYWHFMNKVDLFTAMFDRVLLPLDELIDATLDEREPDPLGRLREALIVCLRDTALNPQRRRVFDIFFHKCEFTEDMGPMALRQQVNMREGRARLEAGLKNARAKGQLPAELNVSLSAGMLHALIGGLLSDWLALPSSVDLENDSELLVDAFFDMLRSSASLRERPCAP